MKQYIVYVCETCGFESKNYNEMREHESTHLGLSVKEMNIYKKLKLDACNMGILVSFTNNKETRSKFDKAIEDLTAFEKEHGIKG